MHSATKFLEHQPGRGATRKIIKQNAAQNLFIPTHPSKSQHIPLVTDCIHPFKRGATCLGQPPSLCDFEKSEEPIFTLYFL
jgi:hypothetical protein